MAAFTMDQVTEVLLADGWHTLQPGTMTAIQDLQIASGSGTITSGLWIGFVGADDSKAYAFPVSPAIAVRYAPM